MSLDKGTNEALRNVIREFDRYYSAKKSGIESQRNMPGRIVHAETLAELISTINPDSERLASLREVAALRIKYFNEIFKVPLVTGFDELGFIFDILNPDFRKKFNESYEHFATLPRLELLQRKIYDLSYEGFNYTGFKLWQSRLTTSTSMVRGRDGKDEYVFFCDRLPFESQEKLMQALNGRLSDGGIEFEAPELQRVVESSYARLPYKEYLKGRGGNFTGEKWLNHPVFKAAFNDNELMANYVMAMQVLNILDFYNPGLHSGWLPREMKEGFGRLLSLGYKGEAFYPVNASTLGHAALVVPKDFKISQMAYGTR